MKQTSTFIVELFVNKTLRCVCDFRNGKYVLQLQSVTDLFQPELILIAKISPDPSSSDYSPPHTHYKED